MAPELIGLISIGAIVGLIYAGLNIAVALGVVSFAGVWILRGDTQTALAMLGLAATDGIDDYVFAVIPLFVLMGLIVSAAGMGGDAFALAERGFGRVRGGLGMATVWANAVFAAITGISIASAAVFTRVAVPEMIRHGYAPRFAVGVVAGSSVLGMLIPPSLLLILYGIVAEVSIGDLFIAGLLPGLFLALVFCLLIAGMARFSPRRVMAEASASPPGAGRVAPPAPGSRADLLIRAAPIGMLAALVLGGIYGGLFTPTEAGAIGALGAFLIALARRAIGISGLWGTLRETTQITVSICLVILAAALYARMLALSGLPFAAAGWLAAADIPFWGVIVAYIAAVVALGCILDSSSILLVMVPLMLPVLQPYGVDLVWFGIVTVVAIEIGLITPPFGISIFVIKGVLADESITLGDIFAGAAPFVLAMLAALAVIAAFPSLSLVLIR